jgi:hypothetical protein
VPRRAGVICCLPANEPKNHFERNRVPERCLLFSILGVGWPFPFHATKSELCVVECRNRRGCAVLVANVLDFGIIVGPDFRVVWVESMDWRQFWPLLRLRQQHSRFRRFTGESLYDAAGGPHLNLQPHKWVPPGLVFETWECIMPVWSARRDSKRRFGPVLEVPAKRDFQ